MKLIAELEGVKFEVYRCDVHEYVSVAGEDALNDIGNGGEEVNEADFDMVLSVPNPMVRGVYYDELEIIKCIYPDYDFWSNTVTGAWLRKKLLS